MLLEAKENYNTNYSRNSAFTLETCITQINSNKKESRAAEKLSAAQMSAFEHNRTLCLPRFFLLEQEFLCSILDFSQNLPSSYKAVYKKRQNPKCIPVNASLEITDNL